MTKLYTKKRKGVSLIEALFVLGIMAVILGMVMVLYSENTISIQANALEEELNSIVNIGHQLNQAKSGYDGLTSTNIANSGLLSSKYIKNKSDIVSPFGTTINYYGYPGDIVLTVDGVPKAICEKIVAGNLGAIQALSVGGILDGSVDNSTTTDLKADLNMCGDNVLMSFEYM